MTARQTEIVTELRLRLVVPDSTSLPVTATVRYSRDDPYAVHVAFHTGGSGNAVVEWTFARQLLIDGLLGPTGTGDVRCWPSRERHGVLQLALSSPSGSALFEVPKDALVDFLTRTYAAVPLGSEGEHVDLDAELALLLWSDPA